MGIYADDGRPSIQRAIKFWDGTFDKFADQICPNKGPKSLASKAMKNALENAILQTDRVFYLRRSMIIVTREAIRDLGLDGMSVSKREKEYEAMCTAWECMFDMYILRAEPGLRSLPEAAMLADRKFDRRYALKKLDFGIRYHRKVY